VTKLIGLSGSLRQGSFNSSLPKATVVAVTLRECACDERTIADALGQKTIEMARLYARGASLAKKMTGVARKFGREVNRRRTKVSTPSREL
jgi:hypothetical protein